MSEEELDLTGMEKKDLDGLYYVSQVSEILDAHTFLQDDDLMEMMDSAIRLLAQPMGKPETAERLLVQFSAASAKFAFLAMYYTNIKKGKVGTDENIKKNAYYTAAEIFDKLAGTMKYIVRRAG